jgi:hypothetical protein
MRDVEAGHYDCRLGDRRAVCSVRGKPAARGSCTLVLAHVNGETLIEIRLHLTNVRDDHIAELNALTLCGYMPQQNVTALTPSGLRGCLAFPRMQRLENARSWLPESASTFVISCALASI